MPTEQQLISKLLSTIDKAVNDFSGDVPALQRQILDDVILLVKDLEISYDGTIKNNLANLKTIGKIKSKIEAIVLNDDYLKKVSEFTEAFKEVSKIQNQYFTLLEAKFKPSKLLLEIQNQSIDTTIESLTEAGIGVNVVEAIEGILRRNITTGGSYAELQTQLRNSILSNKTGGGLLERYTKSVTIDAISHFNRQYSSIVADDLGLKWYWYTGTLIETSREWCIHMAKKKYIHRSELPTIVKGLIDGHQVKINPKTKLWYGALEGTNASNVVDNAGGHSCPHIFAPVSEAVIPKNIRDKFK